MTDDAPLVLSKYERVKLISARTEQLLNGAPVLIDDELAATFDKVSDIAEEELKRGMLPMSVARKLESGKVRIYDLKDFIDPINQPESTSPRT